MSEIATTQPVGVPIVHVIDDEPSICRLFERVCTQIGLRTKSYGQAEAFLAEYDPAIPGCVILDVHLPLMSGLELLEEMSRRGWKAPIVIISGKAEVSHAVRAFRLGSIDFLEKPFAKDEIENVVRRAVEVDRVQREGQAERDEIQKRVAKLTPREKQVMALVVAGKSNRVIAADLGVSPKTVEVHRANVMQKMQADSLAQLVKMVVAEKR